MADPRDKRAAEIQGSIRQILYNDWHPIPVAGLPEDEYDSYIAPVYRILVGSRSEQELIQCLLRLGDDIMGASPIPLADGEHLRPVARKLLELDVKL